MLAASIRRIHAVRHAPKSLVRRMLTTKTGLNSPAQPYVPRHAKVLVEVRVPEY
uniref:Uncharacterized protein n=1 Tax=Hyaloperonospora arabidopsidis (strain Emoy2) TaxID=559515 RepID=M4BFW2_HYAAE